MISQTQKEIWIREAAARLCNSKKRTTIEDGIEAITQGVIFLENNPKARELGYKVADVIHEKIGILMADYYEKCDKYCDTSIKIAVEELAALLGIELLNKRNMTVAEALAKVQAAKPNFALRFSIECYKSVEVREVVFGTQYKFIINSLNYQTEII